MSKTFLITGASTGLGAHMAVFFAPGNEIFVHYAASKFEAEQVAATVLQQGGTPHLVQADLTTEAETLKLITQVEQRVEKLDVLINNAGALFHRETAQELTWALMEKTFRLNVFSLMLLTSRCVPLLERGLDPTILNITSIAMRHGAPTASIYGASKGAVDSFTRGMAKELAPKIRVNAIAPGVIETPFHDKVSSPEKLKAWRDQSPLKINGTSDDITLVADMLIRNPFITGETIDVNGGLFMR